MPSEVLKVFAYFLTALQNHDLLGTFVVRICSAIAAELLRVLDGRRRWEFRNQRQAKYGQAGVLVATSRRNLNGHGGRHVLTCSD